MRKLQPLKRRLLNLLNSGVNDIEEIALSLYPGFRRNKPYFSMKYAITDLVYECRKKDPNFNFRVKNGKVIPTTPEDKKQAMV